MLTVAEATPPLLFAYTVNMEFVMFTSGVPEITPLLKLRPFGSVGWMDQTSTAPPEYVGDNGDMDILRVNVTLV